ncbi:hypothetical protein DPMN_107995 [Dreissena polymorpha]|uniref:Uncharacterized protein n=1 Tax=Dreissena polymorpha TaxID=45954 RepID=A0A9D4QLK5_DREPO|nr:hypothetical protein DPMN_107995 [Dreissena polymorpha]
MTIHKSPTVFILHGELVRHSRGNRNHCGAVQPLYCCNKEYAPNAYRAYPSSSQHTVSTCIYKEHKCSALLVVFFGYRRNITHKGHPHQTRWMKSCISFWRLQL